ncbi:lytic polysaccharide monooxygenase [Plantactinospora sp. KBS50]|uniref:lytic polysaccharide monooxygenase auxiliary activity family 9 protein n=1 Tax=Plantactinospora sp. KBS50 TaxID=2024580 RepID=UPI0018DF98F5|nr:lytic polysaccharide monooxygenase [Plantactinospora sp. KBS50]
MSTLAPTRFNPRLAWLVALGAALAMVLSVAAATIMPRSASAHGSVIDPASRNYGCWLRWGSDFQNPAMATEDPMCWQAWQDNPNAMWNWNGLYRNGVAGNPQAVIPDGQLCSAGHTEDGRYNSMDTIGAWKTTSIGTNFSIKLFDQAGHGADFIKVYVTKQGFDELTQPLGWGNLELVGQIGNTPLSQWNVESGGYSVQVAANAAGRTGRHVVYTIWQASHMDQSYYMCSDVNFGGSSPTTPPTTAAPTTAPPTTAPPTTAPPTTAAPTTAAPTTGAPTTAPGGCSATYTVTSQWTGGFQGEVKVTAGSSAISGWTVNWTYANGQQVTSSWGATLTSSGSTVTATNVSYNGALGAGASTTFGFLGSWNGSSNPAPAVSCTAAA